MSGYWKNCSQRNNVLFIQYEEAKDDIKAMLKRIASFLKRDLDGEKLDKIAAHVQFANMKSNPMTNLFSTGVFKEDSFLRQGKAGGWKDYFNEDQNKFMEEFYMKAIQEIGLSFKDS